MNLRPGLFAAFALVLPPIVAASPARPAASTPPPLTQALPPAVTPLPNPATQRVYGPSGATLIARQTAEGILEGFRKAYHTDRAPRVVIYVNRALIDPAPAAPARERDDRAEAGARQNGRPGGSYPSSDYDSGRPAAPTLADQQTVREIERLFGRAFRHAGAQLADYRIAAALLPDQPGTYLADQSAKERQALANVADIAIEVLISSRNIVVPQVSGDVTYPVPDIQATAIRLTDAAIVGQAAASDIIGKGVQAGRVVQQFDVRDITEATAIALMEDMLTGRL
jgi:hypothetical protein